MKKTNEFIQAYQNLHHEHKHAFSGFAIYHSTPQIKKLVESTNSKTLLDYGAGKGWQYKPGGFRKDLIDPKASMASYVTESSHLNRLMGIDDENIDWYDPGLKWPDPHRKLKDKKYDGVVCNDVMEHVPLQEINNVLFNIYSRSNKFVYLYISAHPAKKTFRDGTNVHVSVYKPMWWKDRCVEMIKWLKYPGVTQLVVQTQKPEDNGTYGVQTFKFSVGV